jgi:transcription initiation factor TFIID TATA-box-binding protein
MADLNIENIVVTMQIAKSLDLEKLVETIPDSNYNPEDVPALIINFEQPKTAVMLFSNGIAVFTGPKSMGDVNTITKMLHDKLTSVGVKAKASPEIKIQNIVVSTDLNKKLDLRNIATKLENAEYDPESFPGLIYTKDDPKIIILLFDSGKIICNGTESEDILTAIDEMTNKLSSLEII